MTQIEKVELKQDNVTSEIHAKLKKDLAGNLYINIQSNLEKFWKISEEI
jgi:hypothetical protein